MALTPPPTCIHKPQSPNHFPSSMVISISPSKSTSIKIPRGNPKIQCFLNSSPILHFPNQQCQNPQIITQNSSPKSPHLNFLQKVVSFAINLMESALISHQLQHPLPKTSNPDVQLAGNFAPVPEHPVRHSLPISGTIPNCINGVYLRNGANPLHKPTAGHHLFDGDGMIHAVTIKNGTASYACRLTETHRLVQERELGRPVFPKTIGELHGHFGIARLLLFYARGLFRLIESNHGIGVGNAGLVYFDRRLLAMSEDDLPYQVRIKSSGDLETIGQYDFNGQLKCNMIAHPKIDPFSGELFALSYDVVKKPYLKYFRFAPDGTKSPDVEIPIPVPTMIHDFAITENFVIIPDQQIVFKLSEMLRDGSPVIYDKTKKSRFGILSKTAKSASNIIWVESEDTFCFHLWNAWEEPELHEIVIIGSCMTPPDSIFHECDENLKSVLSEIRINLKNKKSTRRTIISHLNLEAGMVNQTKLGRKTRYAYLAIAEPWPNVSGFSKVDLLTGEMKTFMYGDRRFGGEPYFLPAGRESEREDDGHVIGFVHDEKTGESELLIVNAGNLEIQASVKMPARVPFGFHGTFVQSEKLRNQA